MIQLGVGAHGARNADCLRRKEESISATTTVGHDSCILSPTLFLLVAFWALRSQRRIMQALTPTDRHKTLRVANAQRYLQQTRDGIATVGIYQEEAPVGTALLTVYKQISNIPTIRLDR